MKKSFWNKLTILITLFCGISTFISTKAATRGSRYAKFYEEKPAKIAVLAVNNQTGDKDCVHFLEHTVEGKLKEKGFEVLDAFSQENADAAIETIVKSWHTSKVEGLFEINLVYLIRSALTGDTLYMREGDLKISTYMKLGGGRLINLIATSVKSNTMKKDWIGKTCADFLLSDLPEGVLSKDYQKDRKKKAGKSPVTKKIKCLHNEQ